MTGATDLCCNPERARLGVLGWVGPSRYIGACITVLSSAVWVCTAELIDILIEFQGSTAKLNNYSSLIQISPTEKNIVSTTSCSLEMGVKRPHESDSAATPAAKKLRKGFRVGPQNLPDGPWKRKVDKIKKDLIHKAKVKKAYKKIKAAEQASSKPGPAIVGTDNQDEDEDEGAEPPSPQLHPERQAMIDEEEEEEEQQKPPSQSQSGDRPRRRKQHPRKPGYFDKASVDAERKKAEAEAHAQEIEKRNEERNRKIAERERFRKAMAKARKPGRDGQRRLGRESGLLLEKVKKMVGDAK